MVVFKRGEIKELMKILLAVILLGILVFAVIFLFKGKGGDLIASIRSMMRFGRA